MKNELLKLHNYSREQIQSDNETYSTLKNVTYE